MTCAVIGYGRWGRVVAGKLDGMPEAELVAVVDPDAGALAVAYDAHGVAVFRTLDDLYDQMTPEMVCVTTPPQLHALHAVTAMAQGSHVWITKPMALTVEDCEAIMAAAHAAERMVAVDHTLLWDPAVVTAAEMVERGELGALEEIHTVRRQPGPARIEGAIYDLLPHDIAVSLRIACGVEEDVPGSTLWADYRVMGERVCEARVRIDLDAGPVINCSAHTLWPQRERVTWVIGDEAALELTDRGVRVHEAVRTDTPGVTVTGIPIPIDIGRWDALEAQLVDVIRWFGAGDWSEEHRATGFHGIPVVTMLEGATAAAEAGDEAEQMPEAA